MRHRTLLPNGLAVISDLYLDSIFSAAMIAAALFGGGYLLSL